ncbi:MAG: UbiD family decarboxylase [Bacteroidetes bacterium]|nr:UbiD family decarboxylase [Bacteroidota bacterium]
MAYSSLRDAVQDLERNGMLRRISAEVDPHLEMAEIHRRVYRAGGPALLFERVKGSPFPAASNIFGTMDRCRFLFRDTLPAVQRLVALKSDPTAALKQPLQVPGVLLDAVRALPRRVWRAPVMAQQCHISDLPAIVSSPMDGGPFVTLPQVYTEDPDKPGPMGANLGMYRIQLGGNAYVPNAEIGLHYQIHRGIGVHQSKWMERGQPLRVSIFVGGPPAHTLAAVMPLPEGLSELTFAGVLGGRRWRYLRKNGFTWSADADFVITGTVQAGALKPEGPFGDHLGYYSLTHDFPVMSVEGVWHRRDAIWPFTVVGRPPQEDSCFGELIHEMTGQAVRDELPGVEGVHAVDAAGVHPLLLAVGSERYSPYAPNAQPLEMLTQANRMLGTGQLSLAKYLIMACKSDAPPPMHDEGRFLQHVLERADFERDLHFQTRTSMDTLDYSSEGLNSGSKLVLVSLGAPRRSLCRELPAGLPTDGLAGQWHLAMPGVLTASGAKAATAMNSDDVEHWARQLAAAPLEQVGLIVLCDDAAFTAASLINFLWVTFTRSNPSHDVYGVGATVVNKHWGCRGPLIIDARIKPFHAPPVEDDPAIVRRVDELAAAGGPLHGLW